MAASGTQTKASRPTYGARWARPGLERGVLMLILAFAIPVANMTRHLLGEPGSLMLAIVLAGGVVPVLARAVTVGSLPRRQSAIMLGATPVIALYVLSTVMNPDPRALSVTLQLALVVVFLYGLSLWHWRLEHLRPVFWVLALFIASHALWWVIAGAPPRFRGFMGHSNSLGQFVLTASYFPIVLFLLSRRRSVIRFVALLTIGASSLLLFATTSRAAWLGAAVALGVYVVWPLLARSFVSYMLFLPLTFSLAVGGTWLYLGLAQGEVGRTLQALSVEYTGKDFFSGRQRFWEDLFIAITDRPWFGHGAGAVAESFTGFEWSAHNLYLQTALQVGTVGLVALLVFLWVVWRLFWNRRYFLATRLAAALFVGMLFHQMFEVSITQNSLANGFLIWLILAVGISYERSR